MTLAVFGLGVWLTGYAIPHVKTPYGVAMLIGGIIVIIAAFIPAVGA